MRVWIGCEGNNMIYVLKNSSGKWNVDFLAYRIRRPNILHSEVLKNTPHVKKGCWSQGCLYMITDESLDTLDKYGLEPWSDTLRSYKKL